MLNIKSKDFNVVAPKSIPVPRGSILPVYISLKRGSTFKQTVSLNLRSAELQVAPSSISVKPNDKPYVKFNITIPKNAHLGEYPVFVNGKSMQGKCSSTDFTLKVTE